MEIDIEPFCSYDQEYYEPDEEIDEEPYFIMKRLTLGRFSGSVDAIVRDIAEYSVHGYGNVNVTYDTLHSGWREWIADVTAEGPEDDVRDFWTQFSRRHGL